MHLHQTSEAKDSVGHFGRNRPQEPRGRSHSSGDGHEGGCKKGRASQRARERDGFSGRSMVKPMPHLTNKFSVLETSTVGSTRDMLTPQSPVDEPKTEKAMPRESSRQPPDATPILIRLSTLRRGTELPLRIHTIGSNTPLLINALIDSGATGQFIDIDYVRSKNLHTQRLPQAIPVYNVDGTLNDAGYITEVVNLMVHYGTILKEPPSMLRVSVEPPLSSDTHGL